MAEVDEKDIQGSPSDRAVWTIRTEHNELCTLYTSDRPHKVRTRFSQLLKISMQKSSLGSWAQFSGSLWATQVKSGEKLYNRAVIDCKFLQLAYVPARDEMKIILRRPCHGQDGVTVTYRRRQPGKKTQAVAYLGKKHTSSKLHAAIAVVSLSKVHTSSSHVHNAQKQNRCNANGIWSRDSKSRATLWVIPDVLDHSSEPMYKKIAKIWYLPNTCYEERMRY